MVGDRMVDDVAGALDVGMRAVWKRHAKPWPRPAHVTPTATIDELAELVALIQQWSR
jgi:FMN phosphatase YigB (HAD superfamily)